jgi:glycerol-3-phosphate responsive antiterminator
MSALGDAMKGLNGSGGEQDSTAVNMDMLKAFMGDMKYTHIYHLPGKVQSVSNKQAKISEDGKTVTLELDLASGDKTQSLQNIIKFR